MNTLRSDITGILTWADLTSLSFSPLDLLALVRECREALAEEPDATAVEVVDGEIVAVVVDNRVAS